MEEVEDVAEVELHLDHLHRSVPPLFLNNSRVALVQLSEHQLEPSSLLVHKASKASSQDFLAKWLQQQRELPSPQPLPNQSFVQLLTRCALVVLQLARQ